MAIDSRAQREAGDASARERIVAAAEAEFLERGFAKASLRHIAAEAGVTTGAIYGYFPSKAALFDALVEGPAEQLFQAYVELRRGFGERPAEGRTFTAVADEEEQMVRDAYGFVYAHRSAFLLLLTRSAGTRWERYLDRYVDLECAGAAGYIRDMSAAGIDVTPIEPELFRALAEMFFRGFFRPLELGLGREEALTFIGSYQQFFHAGYRSLMDPSAGRR